jgi:hypothetical protein
VRLPPGPGSPGVMLEDNYGSGGGGGERKSLSPRRVRAVSFSSTSSSELSDEHDGGEAAEFVNAFVGSVDGAVGGPPAPSRSGPGKPAAVQFTDDDDDDDDYDSD